MKTITYTSTGIRICPYIKGQCPKLEFITSRLEKLYHKICEVNGFSIADNESFLTHRNFRPEFLKQFFPGYEIINESPHNSIAMSEDIHIVDSFKLKDNQLDILQRLQEADSKDVNENFVQLPTAVGKTSLGIYYSVITKRRTFIMCHSSKILDQWKDAILSMTTSKPNNIIVLNSSSKMEQIRVGEKDVSNTYFFLMTPAVIHSYMKTYGYDSLDSLFTKMNIGLKIFDEAHRSLGAIVQINALTSIERTLYMSADFNRASRYVRDQFFAVFSNVNVVKLTDEELSKLKHIIAFFVNYDSHPSEKDLRYVARGAYKWSLINYAKYQFDNEITRAKCVGIVDKIISSDNPTTPPYKILILLELIAHVESIYDTMTELYKGKKTVGRYHSKMSDIDKENALKCDIIISIYGSFSDGINIVDPNIRHVISTMPVDEVTTNQSAGRCRPIPGVYSFIWILCDKGFNYCESNKKKVSRYLLMSKVKEILQKDFGGL